jgi:hypothetical protein
MISVKEYFEARLKAQEERVALALSAADRAVTKAEQAVERRLEGMNEFRAAMADQQAKLPTRTEVDSAIAVVIARLDSLGERITRLEQAQSRAAGMGAGAWQLWLALGGIVALIAGLLMIATRLGG